MEMIKVGPGKPPKRYGNVWDDKGRSDIAEIYIFHGIKVHSLQFLYIENGTLVLSEKHGGASTSINNFDVVKLDYPSEFLTSLSYDYDDSCDPHHAVSSITFGTNKCTYGPFGRPGKLDSNKFNYRIGPGRSFGGFHGSAASSYLETIGLYFRPATQLINNVNNNVTEVKKENVED